MSWLDDQNLEIVLAKLAAKASEESRALPRLHPMGAEQQRALRGPLSQGQLSERRRNGRERSRWHQTLGAAQETPSCVRVNAFWEPRQVVASDGATCFSSTDDVGRPHPSGQGFVGHGAVRRFSE